MIIDVTPRTVIFGDEARAKLIKGANIVANAVKATLGPRGKNVVIDKTNPRRGENQIRVTKDGVTVAREVNLIDIAENTGAQLLKKAAINTLQTAGDGTTTATVLAQFLLNEGSKLVNTGINPVELQRGINKAVAALVPFIESLATPIATLEEIKKVAYISCNSDEALAELVAHVLFDVTKDGVIVVEESNTDKTTVDTANGMKFETGLSSTSRYFITDSKKMEWVKDDCIIMVSEEAILNTSQLETIFKGAASVNKPILIIAKDFDDNVVSSVVQNYIRGNVHCCLVKASGFGDLRRSRLQDIGVFTAAEVFTVNKSFSLSDHDAINRCGWAAKVIVKDNELIILGGVGLQGEYKENFDTYVENLKLDIEETADQFEKDKKKERLATLIGGTALIKVGGLDEIEVKEKMDRLDDAIHAVKCAMELGVVPGGGVTYLKAMTVLANLAEDNTEQRLGIELVRKALMEPLRVILNNSGINYSEAALLMGEVMKQHKNVKGKFFGYNAKDLKYSPNMIESGITDPAKVAITALQAAANIAGMMLTTDCLINYYVEDGTVSDKR